MNSIINRVFHNNHVIFLYGWNCPWVGLSMGGSVLGGIVLGGNVSGWDCPWVEVSWVGLSVGASVRVGFSGVEVSGRLLFLG